MAFRSTRKIITVGMLVIITFSLFFISSINGITSGSFNQTFIANGTGNYVEDFSSTIYYDGASTAFGWGSGTVTKDRNFSLSELDFYSTALPVRGLAVQGRKAYVVQNDYSSNSHTLSCFNINDPNNIVLLSEHNSLNKTMSIAVNGDVVFFGSQGSLNSYNVGDPFDLSGSGNHLDWVGTSNMISDIELNGHLVYYTDYNSSMISSFQIVDARDPEDLQIINTNWNNKNALGLDVVGHNIYIAASTDGFYILNVFNKYSPIVVGHIDTPGNATDVLVDGGFAFVADGSSGIHVIDIRDPANPSILGTYDTPGNARRLKLQGRTLFVADGTGGVQVLDITDASHPTFITSITLPNTWDIDLFGGDLVVGTDLGIYTIRLCAGTGISDISKEVYSNAFDQFKAYDVRVQGDIAYVVGIHGFYTLNISDPSNPLLLDHVYLSGKAKKFDVQGQFAFVADFGHGFLIFNISNPTNIIEVSSINLAFTIDIAVAGDIAWVADGPFGIYLINISNPYSAGIIGSFGSELYNVTSIWIQGSFLYVTEFKPYISSNCLHIYDIRDLSDINLIFSQMRPDDNYDIHVDGDILYLASTSDGDGVWVFNITNPFSPIQGDNVNRDTYGVWSFGSYLLTADFRDGVALVNVSNIDDIGTCSIYPKASAALQITTHGDFTFIANTTNLIILRHFKSAADTYMTGVSTVQSLEIDSILAGEISSAILDATDYVPSGTHVEYFMSADGGAHWEIVTPGVEHNFVFFGDELLWKADIYGPEDRSVHIYSISIDYEYNSAPTIPTLEPLAETNALGLVTVKWNTSSDDEEVSNYQIEMSDSSSFSIILENHTLTTLQQKFYPLSKGIYYFRVRAVDNQGLASGWSTTDIEVTFALLSPLWIGIISGSIMLIIVLIVVILIFVKGKRVKVS